MLDTFIQKHIQLTKPQLDYCVKKAEALHMSVSCFIRLALDAYIGSTDTKKEGE